MEAIRISCAGYPTRKTFDDFIHRFHILASDILKGRYFIIYESEMTLKDIIFFNSCPGVKFSVFLSLLIIYVLIPSCEEYIACKRILEMAHLSGYQVFYHGILTHVLQFYLNQLDGGQLKILAFFLWHLLYCKIDVTHLFL